MNLKLANRLMPIILVVFLNLGAKGQLQTVTASSGRYLSGSSLSVSFTLGEPIINTLPHDNKIVTQGFQQPKLFVTAISELEGLAMSIKAWPNPVTDFVNLETSNELPKGSSYQLLNMNGILIEEKLLKKTKTEISCQQMIPATYFLRVCQNKQTLKTFKIIKR